MNASFEDFTDPVDGTVWSVEMSFMASNWACIWGRGCKGILDEPAEELGQGCCSVGAQMLDDDEARAVTALAATLDSSQFQYRDEAGSGVLDRDRASTRVVDGACIFLNRPGFEGDPGCALHIGALADGDSPMEWKPSVCWQLPLKVERGGGRVQLRRWRRSDWGPEGDSMAWCCTEEPEAFVGSTTVVESLARELEALVGPDVMVQIRSRTSPDKPQR